MFTGFPLASGTPRGRLSTWAAVLVLLAGCQATATGIVRAPSARSVTPRQAILSRPTATTAAARELRLLVLVVNQHRAAIGCPPLIWDERLARVALRHSEAMARRGFFGHFDPEGIGPFERMRRAGISYRAAGENVAAGQSRGIQVYDDWMKSPPHRRNLENCVYTHHGIGLYHNRWTHLFARY